MSKLHADLDDHRGDPIYVLVPNSRHMIDALGPLVGHCTRLVSLRIAILGPCEEPGHDSREQRLYHSCARFIGSVRKTLRKLTFEQCYSDNEQLTWVRSWNEREPVSPWPMDRMFVRKILPVLMNGPWSCLEKIEIRGVGEHKSDVRRSPPPTESELKSHDIAYTDIDPYRYLGKEGIQGWNLTVEVKSFPSAAQVQSNL
jgi:hypothetical protein